MRIKCLAFVLSIFFLALLPMAGLAASYRMLVIRQVPYVADATEGDPRTLDLHVPEGATDAAVVVVAQGRDWRGGEQGGEGLDRLVDLFVSRGLAVASVRYRGLPEVKHPGHVEDLAAAVAWLGREGRAYGIDATRVWLLGHSAGGHLAALMALHPAYLARAGVPRHTIKGVMAISGVYDVMEFPVPGADPHPAEQAFGRDRSVLGDASPTLHVGIDHQEPVPPFLIAYAEDDRFGFDEQATTFYTLFLKHGLPVRLVEVPARTHDTMLAHLGRQTRESPDVLGPSLLHFIGAVSDGRFAVVKDVTSSRGGSARMPSPPTRAVRDVRYFDGPGSDPKLNALDVFVPEGRSGVPVVFYVHGGGWRAGDKGTPQTLIDIFGRMGMAVVSTNYRLSPAVTHPTHIQDVARAFRWTYDHAAEYGLDRDRIYVAGTSAGGHLVTLLALDRKYLRAEGVPDGVIKGVMSVSGIYNFPDKAEPGKVPTRKEQAFGVEKTGLAEASPLEHVRPDAPPVLLTYTDHDIFLEREQAHELYDALVRAGVTARIVEIPDRTHFDQTEGIGVQVALVDDVLGPALVEFMLDRERESPNGDAASVTVGVK